jgi:hypothetical protein
MARWARKARQYGFPEVREAPEIGWIVTKDGLQPHPAKHVALKVVSSSRPSSAAWRKKLRHNIVERRMELADYRDETLSEEPILGRLGHVFKPHEE